MTNFSPNYTCHCLPSNTVNPPSHSSSDSGLGSFPVVQMIGGGGDGGVGGGRCGLRGIAFHDFSVGFPELSTSRVPRPLTLLQGGKEVSRGRREERLEKRHLLRCAEPAHLSFIRSLAAPKSCALKKKNPKTKGEDDEKCLVQCPAHSR